MSSKVEESRTKTGGRQAGTPNRLTAELRAILKDIVAHELEALPQRLEALPSEKRVEVLLKLLPYVAPKVEAVSSTKGESSWSILSGLD